MATTIQAEYLEEENLSCKTAATNYVRNSF